MALQSNPIHNVDGSTIPKNLYVRSTDKSEVKDEIVKPINHVEEFLPELVEETYYFLGI